VEPGTVVRGGVSNQRARRLDKVDARTLAHLLRADLLPEAWIAPSHVRDVRALLRNRALLVRFGHRAQKSDPFRARPTAVSVGRLRISGTSRAGCGWLRSSLLPSGERSSTITSPSSTPSPSRSPHLIKRSGPRQARSPRRGPLAAARDRSTHRHDPGRGDRRHLRCPTVRKLCAWAGITPAVRNSDRTLRHDHISKQGSRWIRFMLGEARASCQALPSLRSSLRGHRQASRQEDSDSGDLTQAPRPLLLHPQGGEPGLPSGRRNLRRRPPRRVRSWHKLRLRHGHLLTEQPGFHRHATFHVEAQIGVCETSSDSSSRPSRPNSLRQSSPKGTTRREQRMSP
jgi:hypothetical protein